MLNGNPFEDKRLGKTVESGRLKQILGYVKDHVTPPKEDTNPAKRKTPKKGNNKRDDSGDSDETETKNNIKITVHQFVEETGVTVISDEEVKSVRPYILCCLIRNLSLANDNFKKFIKAQMEIHEGPCGQRNNATIATHDFDKLVSYFKVML